MPTLTALCIFIAILTLRATYALPQQLHQDVPGAAEFYEWLNRRPCASVQDLASSDNLEPPSLNITEKFHVQGTDDTDIEVITNVRIIKRQNLCNLLSTIGQEALDHVPAPLPADYYKQSPPLVPGQPIPPDTVSFSLRSNTRLREPATYLTLFHTILGLIQWNIEGSRYVALKFSVYEGIGKKATGDLTQGLDEFTVN